MNAQPKALFDITVLMEALINEHESNNASAAVLALAAAGRVQGYVSAGAIEPIHDALSRGRGKTEARAVLQRICAILTVAPIDAAVIDGAIGLGWQYLDDALTFESARRSGLENLITLNGADFDHPAVAVQAPEEFLESIQ
jgi:predicted nucleic acid-binding protein